MTTTKPAQNTTITLPLPSKENAGQVIQIGDTVYACLQTFKDHYEWVIQRMGCTILTNS